jgi:hypothetical protein
MPIAVAANDLVELKLVGLFDTKQVTNNVFHFQVDDDGGAKLDEFAAGFFEALQTDLLNITANVVEYLQIDARLLDEDGDLINGETYIIPTGSGVGADTSGSLPPYVTWTFKYLRENATFRHGFKRFAGVPSIGQVKGFPVGGEITNLNNMAGTLSGPFSAFSIGTDGLPDVEYAGSAMHNVVLQRVINGDPITPVNVALVPNIVFDKIGTQNSRKYGVGV